MIAILEGEKCHLKPHNVSSNPSLIVAGGYNASKIYIFKVPFLFKLSLLSPKIGGLHISGSI